MELLEWTDGGLRARLGAQDMVDLAYGPGRVETAGPGGHVVVAVVGLGRIESYLNRLVRAVPEVASHRKAMEGGFTIYEAEPEVRAEVWIPWLVFQDLFRRGGESRRFPAPVRIRLRGYEPAWTSGWSARIDFPPRQEYAAADLREGSE